MSKAPKAKKGALHYQPYQALGNGESDEPSMDLGMSDLPLHLDPVLSGLSSSMSRNLWDDWNENDANFGMKFDMFTDDVSSASTASSTASPNPSMHVSNSGGFEQQQNASPNAMHSHTRVATPTHEDPHKPRANVQRSLSEDIVNMLDATSEAAFAKQMEVEQRRDAAIQNMMFHHPAGQNNAMGFQQQMHPNHMQQFQHQQMQMQRQQQQFQQQQQQFQQAAGINGSGWMNTFGGGNQTTTSTTASASDKLTGSNPPPRRLPHALNSANLDAAVAEGAASLVAKYPASHAPAGTTTSASAQASSISTAPQQSPPLRGKFGLPVSSPSNAKEKSGTAGTQGITPAGAAASSADGANPNKSAGSNDSDANGNNDTNMADQSQQGNGMGVQGMVPNPFMMYPMMGPQGMNMMGMPMQMPMGMNGMNGMNGMQLPMQMQLQLQLQMQMQMAQLAQMNGMGGMNGMQMPMGLPGMPMGMNMQMPMNMNMQQVNPQSGSSGDVEMTPVQAGFPMAMPAAAAPTLKPARALQPKGIRPGPGFVSIARKPEEPEVSSILKSLMDEEAKKKEKKLERNRDSARESRRKQQTYVETLENGIKRLQINRDLVRSYRWGVSGPGFGPLPCPNSPQMFDWKNRLEVVTGRTEAFSSIQNPANFKSLMRLNRQRRTLAMQHEDRERAVWKCFVFVGRQLAAMRTRVLQVQMLRTFSENPLAMELDTELKLSADQKLQLQCHAQQMFNQEVVELTKLFKIFFALRNEALRLNILSPTLERYFREVCSFNQLQKLLQWSENQRTVIETDLSLDEV